MSHRCTTSFRLTLALLVSSAGCFALTGCSSKDVPAKASFDEKDKQQIEELNKQRVDEWGKKIK
jgi:hypothetical protein